MDSNVEDTKQEHAPGVVVAVSAHAIFAFHDAQALSESEPLPEGTAFAFIKAVRMLNDKLVCKNADETLQFRVMLMAIECQDMEVKITESVKHYGLDIGMFCHCSKEDFIQKLQANKIRLFLSTDGNDVLSVLQRGIPAALLGHQPDQQVISPVKVLLSGDVIGLRDEALLCLTDVGFSEAQLQNFKAAKSCMREFATMIGEMRKRFGLEDSPLRTSVMTVWGSRDVCVDALKMLQGWGVHVDEAFCLAGAPASLILSRLQPHMLCLDGLQTLRGS